MGLFMRKASQWAASLLRLSSAGRLHARNSNVRESASLSFGPLETRRVLAANADFAGGVLGTFTFRYPIPCSRFAPYAWLGGGWTFGGDDRSGIFSDDDDDFDFSDDDDNDGHLMAQYGVGFETRFTPRIGWTNDLSYNHVEGGRNDFWQVRTGINFAF